jgi:hypothetical protein
MEKVENGLTMLPFFAGIMLVLLVVIEEITGKKRK